MPRTKIISTAKIIEILCNGDDPAWMNNYSHFKFQHERQMISIDQCQQIYFRYLKVQGGLF